MSVAHVILCSIAAFLCATTVPAAQAHSGSPGSTSTHIEAGDFTLRSAGGPVNLNDFRGKVVALYFGYTHCEDTCPITLGRLTSAINLLTPAEASQIQPLFITVDPTRDDAQRLAAYSAPYSGLIGLTGSEAEINVVAKAYGINYRKSPVNSSGNYSLELPSVIFLVGRQGQLLRSRPHGNNPELIAAALRKALLNH
jgi:protein SCO1/2